MWILEHASVRLPMLVAWLACSKGWSGMNLYGRRLMEFWAEHRPRAFAELEDPEAFFTRAGEEISVQVAALIPQLAGVDLPGEDTVAKAARVSNARSQAVEIALADSGLWGEPELTREEWEAATLEHEDSLIEWAWRMQEQLEGLADHGLSIEDSAARFLLPVELLRGMAEANSPYAFLHLPANWAVWEASVEARWVRDSTTR